MNRNFLLAGAMLLLCTNVNAQVQEGKVVYEDIIKMDFKMDKDNEQFIALMPKEMKRQCVLWFTKDATIYLPVKKEKGKEEANASSNADGGPNIIIHHDEPDDRTYTDFKEGKTTEQKEFMGRKFLIAGEMQKQSWKMTGQQKTILTYPCLEAISIKDKDTCSVWFTTAIPVAAGPLNFLGLPGLILEVKVGNNHTVKALEVTPGAVEAGVMVQPKQGKKVTRQEFQTIVEEKTKEMGGPANGGRIMIKMAN